MDIGVKYLDEFHIETLAILGSVVQGEVGSKSDVDILVSFISEVDMCDTLELEIFLSKLVNVEENIVSNKTSMEINITMLMKLRYI